MVKLSGNSGEKISKTRIITNRFITKLLKTNDILGLR